MIFHSSVEPLYYLLPIMGLIIGLFATALGGGGGFFFLPVLTLVLNVPTQTAVITSLVAALPIGFVGVIGHHKKNNINYSVGLWFSIFGIAGAFLGAYITSKINPEQLKDYFGIYSLVLAIGIVYGILRNKDTKNSSGKIRFNKYVQNMKSAFFGLCGGTISGSFGTSGTGPVLAGLLSMHIPLKLVIGTSLLIVSINSVSAIAAHMLVGQIDLTLIAFLTAGSIVGATIGPKLISKVQLDNKENSARYLYALILSTIGLLMIIR